MIKPMSLPHSGAIRHRGAPLRWWIRESSFFFFFWGGGGVEPE